MSLSREIDHIFADAIARKVFPGAVVLIAVDRAVRHFAAYGTTMYDVPGSRPVVTDTIYDVASLTKMFTATAALRLHDRGLLDLEAPVAAYLPDVCAAGITVWHLLTHTSGLDVRLSALREYGRAGLMAAAYGAGTVKLPGTAVAYTNVNSLLLGDIVARLHGAPLDVAIDELVVRPLGLRDTRFCPPEALLGRIAPTEVDDSWRGGLVHGTVHDESAHVLGGVAGHAGLFSTAADLYLFCQAWLARGVGAEGGESGEDQGWLMGDGRRAERLLRPETVALATTNHTAALNLGCGLGWMMDRPNFMGGAPPGSFGHTGFTGPALVVVPQGRLSVVVLSNRVYPRRQPPSHHAVTAASVSAALMQVLAPA